MKRTKFKIDMKGKTSSIGTSYQGELKISYADLVTIFGPPNSTRHCYKIDAEWIGAIDGEVFTIYNYKTGKSYLGTQGKTVEEITDWHIGAKKRLTAEKVLFLILKHTLKQGRS
ncbi:MAG: hypothetical protein COV74_03485 [Candidatus Omnitrophica bacterium CG11_big_fil_rev_8_21_14_0_20_45_26]|uniref:Uncharacterized protein n=1 Tax=Candidatus Abzuiibacterium crystallinum TaxID=1974748 RepID=A0A2H0LQS3_9BACT|nr:MAG: hypothetical protein COV74_03485 [Candidatus Omnitrophica bacterium CG11_big_fil_rev_8_21_14_0_20_45_26]PIW63327.1 MAG: hypothetical protein COW12_10825 [Candidatus Omnitrophica bacterium CG12_big_fil_rev_8_21_14_0_65_45_16]